MALNEGQEKELLEGNAAMKAFIESVKPTLADVPVMKAALAAKDAEIADLKKAVQPLSVNSASQALKTAYPDVPEATLTAALSLAPEAQKAMLEPVQKQAAEFKVKMTKTDPSRGWEDAGGIEATTDAERLARKAESAKVYGEHKKAGNVFGMLDERAGEIAAHVRRAFAR